MGGGAYIGGGGLCTHSHIWLWFVWEAFFLTLFLEHRTRTGKLQRLTVNHAPLWSQSPFAPLLPRSYLLSACLRRQTLFSRLTGVV